MGDANQPTPVAAQTVFQASGTRRSSSTLKWPVIILSLIVVGIVAVGVLVYQSQSITPRQLPSPEVARGIESIVPLETITEVTQDTVSGTLIGVIGVAGNENVGDDQPGATEIVVSDTSATPLEEDMLSDDAKDAVIAEQSTLESDVREPEEDISWT